MHSGPHIHKKLVILYITLLYQLVCETQSCVVGLFKQLLAFCFQLGLNISFCVKRPTPVVAVKTGHSCRNTCELDVFIELTVLLGLKESTWHKKRRAWADSVRLSRSARFNQTWFRDVGHVVQHSSPWIPYTGDMYVCECAAWTHRCVLWRGHS